MAEELNGGGLAVRSRDGENRPRSAGPFLLPAVRQLDLRHELDTGELRSNDHSVCLGNTGRRTHQIAADHDLGELFDARGFEQLDTQFLGESTACGRDGVIADDDLVAMAQQRAYRCLPGDCKAVHEHSHQAARLEKSAMKIPSARPTEIAAINQNRMITVVSGQPTSSKW